MQALPFCSGNYIDMSNTQYSEEVLDTDFLNNYNMDDNIDEIYYHTFFRKLIVTLMSQTQIKVCITTKTTLTNISIIQRIFLLFIPTYVVAYRKILSNLNYSYLI